MKAEIFSIGTEILLGEILDSNAKFIASELASIGIDVYYKTSVGDNEDRLSESIKLSYSRSDLVIASGGIGPTDDDITKEMFAKFFNRKLIKNQIAYDNLLAYFSDPSKEMPESNLKQIYMPDGCTVLYNDFGTAAGFILEVDGKIAVIMPGPPREMIPMFKNKVIPYLEKYTDKVLVSQSLNLAGIGESGASETIKELMQISTNPTIAPYAGEYEMRFRITASAKTREEATELLQPTIQKLYNIFPDYIYGRDDDTLSGVILEKLIQKNMTIATAESCTGGLLASSFIDNPNASKAFVNGVITYSNESKIYELGVKPETLEEFGAVSEQVAREMADGILSKSSSDIGISITGIAGPDGGTEEKPVGLIFVGIACKDKETEVIQLNIPGERVVIRNRTVKRVLYKIFSIVK